MFLEKLKSFFNVNLNEYESIGINLEINKVMLVAIIVFGISIVLFALYRNNIRALMVQMLRHDAISEENAKTLAELGFANSRILAFLLSRDNMLTKLVDRVGRKKYTYDEYMSLTKEEKKQKEEIDFSSAAFFIVPEQLDRARHIKEKYLTSKTKIVLWCVFLTLMYIILATLMPEILTLINNL